MGCELHHRAPQLKSSKRVEQLVTAVRFDLHLSSSRKDSQPAPEVVAMVGRARLVVAPVGSYEERESLTGSPEGPEGAESGGVKRKSAPPETGSKFKVVGTMVVAMQRFQGPLAVWHLRVSRSPTHPRHRFVALQTSYTLLPPSFSVCLHVSAWTRSEPCCVRLCSRAEPASDFRKASQLR